jgi:hypothetical protein
MRAWMWLQLVDTAPAARRLLPDQGELRIDEGRERIATTHDGCAGNLAAVSRGVF